MSWVRSIIVSPSNGGEIKDIPDVPRQIIEAANSGKLVLFIGAGVSRIIGCPSWQELASRQLDDLYEKKAINYHEYTNLKSLDARKLLSICRQIYEEKNIQPLSLKSVFEGNEERIKKFPIFKDLYAFNAVYVTTNFDDHLDRVAQETRAGLTSTSEPSPQHGEVEIKEKPKGEIYYLKDELLISNLSNGNVIHLHGRADDEAHVVMTIVDYMKHYERDSKPDVLLKEIFNTYTVLFVGYGLEEYEILEFMVNKSQTVKGETKYFMLYPIFKRDANLLGFHIKYFRDLGVHLVPYPLDENGYEQLAEVIKDWAKQVGPIARPQGYLERIKLIDEVL